MNIEDLTGSHAGQKALIVLGGPSAKKWKDLQDMINPNIILGANGVNAMIPNLDYWMCIENMRRTFRLAAKGDSRARQFANMFQHTGARTRIVHRKSYHLLKNTDNAIPATKAPSFDLDQIPTEFSFRNYGNGYIGGAIMKDMGSLMNNLKLAVGTVGLQLLHHSGILGVSEVHTIGFDLCFKDGSGHHAYEYPQYEANNYFSPLNFKEHMGLKTMSFWIESAQYLLGIIPLMEQVGLKWIDHSDGLLQRMGK
jgi:hypothetical protein